jgi:hypothetical protein
MSLYPICACSPQRGPESADLFRRPRRRRSAVRQAVFGAGRQAKPLRGSEKIPRSVAHIMLFLLFTAQIARTVRKFDNPMYEDEFNVHNFLQHPDILSRTSLRWRWSSLDFSRANRRYSPPNGCVR